MATNKTMITHDVASPLTTTNTEITAIDLGDPALANRFIDSLFTLEINDGKDAETSSTGYATIWKTHDHSVRIVQVRLGVTIYSGSSRLPDWGFQQYEVNGAKVKTDPGSTWTAKDIIGQISKLLNATTGVILINRICLAIGQQKERQPVYRPFMSKFVELQSAMLIHNAGLTEKHPYQSAPYTWPLVLGGISFWTKNDPKQQIYLLANPFGWWISDLALLIYPTLIMADLLTHQRGLEAIDERKSCLKLMLLVYTYTDRPTSFTIYSGTWSILPFWWFPYFGLGLPLSAVLLYGSNSILASLPACMHYRVSSSWYYTPICLYTWC
jgi:dolichyl-phosphate-mannose-protein mannosyltransferase